MQIGFLMLSDHSEAVNGKLYLTGGGWNILRFPQLPQEWGFSIGLGIDVAWEETNSRHELQLDVHDPDGNELGQSLTAEFEAGRPTGMTPGQDQRLVMAIGTRILFSTPGPHAVVIQINGEEIGRTRFYVATEPAQGQQAPPLEEPDETVG